MTWKKFMTYAHQNIELRPIPYIDNPLPILTGGVQDVATNQAEATEAPPARPKLLSKEAEKVLRDLENIFKNAKPIKDTKELAGNAGTDIATQ